MPSSCMADEGVGVRGQGAQGCGCVRQLEALAQGMAKLHKEIAEVRLLLSDSMLLPSNA